MVMLLKCKGNWIKFYNVIINMTLIVNNKKSKNKNKAIP
jgi:hypothetical protein